MSPFSPSLAAKMIQVSQYHFCCMYAVCIWDWIVSIPDERRYIWKAQWTVVKGLYLFTRYYVLAVMPYILWEFCTNHEWSFCSWAYKIPVILATPNQFGAEGILLIRTYAFFGRDKRLLAALICMMLGLLSYQIYVATSAMIPLPFLGNTGPCLPRSIPGQAQILGYFVAPLSFDTIITVITLVKTLSMRQRGGSASQTIQVFLKEGFFYYFFISGANLMNGIFYFQPHSEMSAIMIPLSIMLSPILACRMIIDIRARADSHNFFPTNDQYPTARHPAPVLFGAHPDPIPTSPATAGAEENVFTTQVNELSAVSNSDDKRSVVLTTTYLAGQLSCERSFPDESVYVDAEKAVAI
ncbi:unnamed protein product [Peniophora sp. CBMAI 1063]|nr:unnamed protein product [Peniophora sp. CBMAI 1063]